MLCAPEPGTVRQPALAPCPNQYQPGEAAQSHRPPLRALRLESDHRRQKRGECAPVTGILPTMSLLKIGQSVQSEITNQRYIVKRPLGSGGFGETYAVARLDEVRDTEADETCLKITSDAASWHGEAYFGGLLRGDPHVVRVIDAFPIMVGSGRAARMRFCIEMELIDGGTVDDACEDGRLLGPRKERTANSVCCCSP